VSGVISTYLAQKWLTELSSGTIATYTGLHYASPPSDDPTSTELDGGSYHRIKTSWTLNNTTISISSTLLWVGLNATTISHIALYDSQYKGNLLAKITLASPRIISQNGTFELSPSEMYLSLS